VSIVVRTTWDAAITDVYVMPTLVGKWEKIGGVDTYVATPSGDYPKDKVILFLADVHGPQLINARVRSLSFFSRGMETGTFLKKKALGR